MNHANYLLDNNVLGSLGHTRRTSQFFRNHCRVPAEVAHEARRSAFAEQLAPVTIAMTSEVLEQLKRVMRELPASASGQVDLYSNKGGADPILIAMALALNEPAQPSLFGSLWVVVSEDKDVLATADRFAVPTASTRDLIALIDAN